MKKKNQRVLAWVAFDTLDSDVLPRTMRRQWMEDNQEERNRETEQFLNEPLN